jgi:hypothetical protein
MLRIFFQRPDVVCKGTDTTLKNGVRINYGPQTYKEQIIILL